MADGAGVSLPAARLMREASLKVPIRETITASEPLLQPRKVAEPVSKTAPVKVAAPAKAAEKKVVKAAEIIDYTPKENVAERLAKRFGAAVGSGAVKALREMSPIR